MGYYLDFYGPAVYDFFFTHGQQSAHVLVESVREYLRAGMKVLDVGTGTGFVAFEVASLIGDGYVVGIDIEEDALLLARHKLSKKGLSNITFQKGDALNLEFEDSSFDITLANQVPVALPDKLHEMVRVLRPGGVMGIASPYPPGNKAFQWLHDVGCELAVQQGRNPPEMPGGRQSEMRELFEQVGLELVKLEQMSMGSSNFEAFLLNFITQGRYMHLLVSTVLQIEEDDKVSLTTGCLEFLEVGKKILDEKYGGEIEYESVIALGKKAE